MSDAYSEHIPIFKRTTIVTIVAKTVKYGFEQTTFSTCMGLASTLATGAWAVVDTSACSLKCINKRKKTPALTYSTRIVLNIVMT